MQTTVGEMLEQKGRTVWNVTPNTSAYDALRLMADKGIGAVLVMECGDIRGVFSERDCARKLCLEENVASEIPVTKIMSTAITHVEPGNTVEHCMALMTEKRVRHLPVLENGELMGLVSIGDIVKTIISEQRSEIHELSGYVNEILKNQHGR